MKATWLATGLLAAAGATAFPAEARADVHVGIGILLGHDHDRGYRDTYRIGYERGLREGSEHGYSDGRRGRSFNFWHAGEYRHGEGYQRWMGPRSEYLAGFRRGYEQAYRRAYFAARERGDHRYGYRGRDGYGDDDDRFIYEEPSYRNPYPRR